MNERLGHALKWCEEIKDKLLLKPSYQQEWKTNNRKHIKKYLKKWGEDNKGKLKINHSKYSKTEKGKANKQRVSSKRRTKEKNIINTLTAQEWVDILKEYKFKCAYCGKEFTLFDKATKDHVIPISKGGNNTKENVVPACQSCNSKKGDRLVQSQA